MISAKRLQKTLRDRLIAFASDVKDAPSADVHRPTARSHTYRETVCLLRALVFVPPPFALVVSVRIVLEIVSTFLSAALTMSSMAAR